ncbi:three-Cys-motif partner protein TcmP [Bradyrhizobium sp. Arg237L]|uniref:three-Cys-motif partner protein TcmP n=1 Tax=Bradyrhizobium sp. Arg237L TaxID=3003352 RepID=UPI00249DF2A9|nr:three-Cys-motif partner protein TcmP [Bradyrhizobium sp. Arg237L]MDI4238842.1 three-Cys-motif partner protein TcmP [Bradyrhizobium sp. Arg237L]
MADPYFGREQTRAKHFILKSYLQALAFKVLTFSDLTYVDGFSGPWESKTENFRDSSFMIAIDVLRDAQQQILHRTGIRRRIGCFFSEKDSDAYAQLEQAVAEFHQPQECFEIKTYEGKFEDAVLDIRSFARTSFPIIFIDPTGWTGYPFHKIKPLFSPPRCEVLINFMYDFINRFAYSADTEIINSMAPILGGQNWPDRLDPDLPRGLAVEKLFRETLKASGDFKFVVSTKIDKATAERPHFFIVYGTKSADGLKVFRQTEYDALRKHAKNRANAMEKQREQRLNVADLFAGYEAEMQEATVDEIVAEQKSLATNRLIETLAARGQLVFSDVASKLLEQFMLRETNIKDICVDLAKAGRIENTWGSGNRKPRDRDLIILRTN